MIGWNLVAGSRARLLRNSAGAKQCKQQHDDESEPEPASHRPLLQTALGIRLWTGEAPLDATECGLSDTRACTVEGPPEPLQPMHCELTGRLDQRDQITGWDQSNHGS